MTDVEVSVDESAGQEPSPTVIVVEDDSSETLPTVIDLVERITRLEGRVTDVESRAFTAEITAESAAEAASEAGDLAVTALDVAVEASELAEDAAEVAVETADETGVLPEVFEEVDSELIEPDITPKRTHPLFRSISEWRGSIAKS